MAFRRTQLGLMKIIDLKNMYQLEEDKAGNIQCDYILLHYVTGDILSIRCTLY